MSPAPPSSSSASSRPATASSPAATYLSHPRFNRTYTFPASPTHPELQISYADVGRQPSSSISSDDIPTVLFVPGMFATRLSDVGLHPIAERSGARIVVVDRYVLFPFEWLLLISLEDVGDSWIWEIRHGKLDGCAAGENDIDVVAGCAEVNCPSTDKKHCFDVAFCGHHIRSQYALALSRSSGRETISGAIGYVYGSLLMAVV